MTTATVERPQPPQHMTALALANKVRSARKDFKDELGALSKPEGCALLATYIEDDKHLPEELDRMPVWDCIMAIRAHGRFRAEHLLMAAQITRRMDRTNGNETSRQLSLGGLTGAERLRLSTVLRAWAEK
jgi:hypothetical protein